jgi:glycosyltransferase involved in cell wall biosynthesis
MAARARFYTNMKISIVIPVFNEVGTILKIVGVVEKASFGFDAEREIIIVDDGSTDGTADILKNMKGAKIISLGKNMGKGAAIKKGFEASTGDFVIIQDADLEYTPSDYPALFAPIVERKADVVFGTRFRGEYQRVLYFWHYLGNSFLTTLSNMFTNLNLSDMEVGYKVFSREVIQIITPKLKSKRFGIEPELTARVAHGRWKIYEVPIHYDGRTYEEGKKIGWRDGVKAIFAILYFNLFGQ